VRPARLLPLALLLSVLSVLPSRALVPAFAFQRVALGSIAAPVERAVAVPPGAVLVGVTWAAGLAEVSVRPGLGAWETLENDPGEAGSRPGTEPFWIGRGVSVVSVRVVPRSPATDVAVDFAGSGSSASSAAPATRTLPRLGAVVTRPGWGADERWRSGRVEYTTPAAVVVHHTVTSNDYTAAEAASYVRAVYSYHTRSRHWSDIGYNLLVDRFGTVYEGRYGDFTRGVVGAHTAGFNDRTISVSLLGNYDTVETPAVMLAAVERVGAWAAERWRFDPRTSVTLTSSGSERFPRGAHVTVPRMPGHRDLGITACPGRYAYAHLPAVRSEAWRLLRAVLSTPVVTGAPVHSPDQVTVTASLDHSAWWTAQITDTSGTVLAETKGRGTSLKVSWDGRLPNGLPALPGTSYMYRLSADDHVHGPSDPKSGTFQGGMPRVV
jgi:hypothetical protein